MLALHIAISLLAAISIIAGCAKLFTSRTKLKTRTINAMSLLSGGSVLTGAILILQGASLARVCAEAGILVSATVAVTSYSKKVSAQPETTSSI
jgi:hypothetical protein